MVEIKEIMKTKMNQKPKKEANPLIVGGVLLGMVAVILLVISIRGMLRTNPYGEETRIDNFSESYGDMVQNEKDLIFHQLYLAIVENLRNGQEAPKSGALIRAGTAEKNYDNLTKVHSGEFIVDIAEVEQTYKIQFEWAEDEDNQNLGGYPVVVSCPPADLVIYSGGCVDDTSGEIEWVHDYQLAYTFGATKAMTVEEMIEDFWDDRSGDGYEMTVDETSLVRLKDEPEYTYQFRMSRENMNTGDLGWYTVTVWLEDFSNEGEVTVKVVGD